MKINEIDHPTKIENDVIMSTKYGQLRQNDVKFDTKKQKEPQPNPNIEMKSQVV